MLFSIIWTLAPILLSLISFLTFVHQGNELTVGIAFTVGLVVVKKPSDFTDVVF